MTSGVTYILLIHFFRGSETHTAASDSISTLLSFVPSWTVCVHSSETLASLWQVNVLSMLCPELPNYGSTVAVMGMLQMALPYARLCQRNCYILKISDVKCLTKVYETSASLSVCMWEVSLRCKTHPFKAEGFLLCCYG